MKIEDLDTLPTIHYTEMAKPTGDSESDQAYQTFLRELPRLLAEGHEGKWALIKGEEVVGLFATFDEGYGAGRERFLMQPFLVQPVREWQPLFRTRVFSRYASF